MRYVKRVVTKGHAYYYFRAEKGLVPLPDIKDPAFGEAYARCLGAKSKRRRIAQAVTVSKMVEQFENSPHFRSLAASTQRTYGFYLTRLVELIGNAPASMVERRDIYEIMARYEAEGNFRAASMMLVTCNQVWKFGRQRELVSNDPAKGIEKHKGGEYEPWPEDLVQAALASEDWLIRLSVALMYFTAQRIGDCCQMRRNDIQGGIVKVTQQKTGKELEIPVHKELARILDMDRPNTMTILSGPKGGPARPEYIRKKIQAWAAGVVPHGLRKNAVNALLEAGCSVGETSAISGQSLKLVEHYAKRRNNRKMAGGAILKWESAG